VQYPIPGNDDAIRSVALLTKIVADAAAEGLMQRHGGGDDAEAEPMAEWERELLAQADEAPAATEAAPAEAEAPAAETEAPVAEEAPAAETTEDAAASDAK